MNSILDNYSSLNRFHVILGKRNSDFIESNKYNLQRAELYNLFIKHITENDINNIIKLFKLKPNEPITLINECRSIINTAQIIGGLDYKELFMERVLLDSCYSAILLLKTVKDRIHSEKEGMTNYQLDIMKSLISIKDKLTERDYQFVWHNWCCRANKKLDERERNILINIYKYYLG
ncbi:MAG: hypothetical protein IPJ01_10305 [Micavibrio sp.]|nr:hypothetical protein [Micavibrio sp.]